ncbi:MAG: hypothetical protein ACP5OM_07635 [Methanothrix sp.]
MFADYIQAALDRAKYKVIEECRRELISVIGGWMIHRPRMGRSIPFVGGIII